MQVLELQKHVKLIRRRYITPTTRDAVHTVVPRYCVPKGETDVRLVWDSSKNGANAAVTAPTFYLMGFTSVVQRVFSSAFMADFDVGEMFHKFMLHPDEKK